MASYSEDLRKIMNRLDESAQTKLLDEEELISEEELVDLLLGEDIIDDIQDKLSRTGTSVKALVSTKAKGAKARDQLRNRFEKEWKEYLGRTDRKGSMEDMLAFLTKRVGFQPTDLNTIIGSNVAPQAQAAAEEPDEKPEKSMDTEVKVDKTPDPNPEKEGSGPAFTNPDGSTDMKAVRKALSKMKPGERLEVNGKTYFVAGADDNVDVGVRTVPAESIEEADLLGEGVLMEFDIRKPLNMDFVRKILNRAAAHAFDTYLLNRPSNAGAYGSYDDGDEVEGGNGQQAGAPDQDPNTDGVNLKRMWDSLQKEGLEREDIRELKQLVSSTRSLRTVKDPASVKMLAAVGYAFLKARK